MARIWSDGFDLNNTVAKQSPRRRWWQRFMKPKLVDYGAVFRMCGVPEEKWTEVTMTIYLSPREAGTVWFDNVEIIKRNEAPEPSREKNIL